MLLWGTTSLRNSYELVNLLRHFRFGKQDRLYSFDVTSLFTRVPVPEVLSIVKKRLEEMRMLPEDPISNITTLTNKGIMKLLEHVLDQCFFTWDGALFKQKSGLPMGGRLSPILSNLFMEDLEFKALSSAQSVPRLYFRYVDDVVIVWNEEKGSYHLFLDVLNQQDPNIVLTAESEQNGSLPYLDIRINRSPKEIGIYRKSTHCDRYLQYRSIHSLSLKRNLVRSLWLRARRLLRDYPNQLRRELDHLQAAFTNPNNGYPLSLIKEWFSDFRMEALVCPEILEVKTRLKAEDVFDLSGQQIFKAPSATSFFMDQGVLDLGEDQVLDGTEEGDLRNLLAAAPGELVNNEDTCDLSAVPVPASSLLGTPVPGTLVHGSLVPGSVVPVPGFAGALRTKEPEANSCSGDIPRKRPVMIVPYYLGISDRLRKTASKYGLLTWYQYPGRLSDMFNVHRGRNHPSKTKDAVYCTTCVCGVQYVGQTGRNLKVRLSEHLTNSSNSSLSAHLLNTGHKPTLKDTQILFREKNEHKRKLIESLCIEHKKSKLCNTGVSLDLPVIWNLCAAELASQLKHTD